MVKDNLNFFWDHETEEAEQINTRPVCDCCGYPIQESSYHQIGGLNYCDSCLENMVVYTEE